MSIRRKPVFFKSLANESIFVFANSTFTFKDLLNKTESLECRVESLYKKISAKKFNHVTIPKLENVANPRDKVYKVEHGIVLLQKKPLQKPLR